MSNPMNQPDSHDGDAYQQLQAIYLKWHDGKRPLSGYINELAAYTHKQTEQVLERLKVEQEYFFYADESEAEAVPLAAIEAELKRLKEGTK